MTIVILAGIAMIPPKQVHAAGTYSVNSVRNGDFEGGVDTSGLPIYWGNATHDCNCQPPPTITVNNTEAIYNNAARLDIGKTAIGFMGIWQSYPQNTLFSNFTERQDEIDFWFRLDPKYDGLGDLQIKFLAVNAQELDYVIDPDLTVLSYPNQTFTYGALVNQASVKYILLGRTNNASTPLMAAPSTWVHFRRDVTADWVASMSFTSNSTCTLASPCMLPGFPLNDAFYRIEFDMIGYQNPTLGKQYGMTAWLDNVNFYWNSNTPAPPPPVHFLKFNFTDAFSKVNVDRYVKWKVVNSTSDIGPYTRGAQTLPDGDYTLEAYYPTLTQPYLIYRARIPFDTNVTIALSLLAEPLSIGAFVAFSPTILDTTTIQQDSSRLVVDVKAPTGTSYTMFANVPYLPKAIVKTTSSRVELVPGVDWTYDAALSIATVTDVAPALFSIYLQEPARIPNVTFTDRAGANVNSLLFFNVTNSLGKPIPMVQHQVTPDENYPYYLQAYYQGHKIYRNTIDFSRTSPIQLQMLRLSTGYIVVNSTVVGIDITGQSSNSLTFDLTGPGPFLILVKVPQKPLYIELNGARYFWSYDGTNHTAIIEIPTQGSVSLVYTNPPPQQPSPSNPAPDYTNYYIAGGILAGSIAASVGIGIFFTRKKNGKIIVGTGQPNPRPNASPSTLAGRDRTQK